jgi:hypothetical protein
MLRRTPLFVIAAAALPFMACGSPETPGATTDAGGPPTYTLPRDAGKPDVTEVDAKTPWARMQAHSHTVLASVRLQIVYLGAEGSGGGADSFDPFFDWLLTSSYWSILKQYGVGPGVRIGSVRLAPADVIPAGAVKDGLITAEDLETAVFAALHPGGDADAGTDAADDGSAEAGDAGAAPDASTPPRLIPVADAYVFFLPAGVNVNLGQRGAHTFQTCVEAGGYHSYDGAEPYAVLPPCTFGRSTLAVSHEVAEMATDPVPGNGWYSDKDADNAGGEVGDLCNQSAPHGADGWDVTQLWSNADGDCEPN